MRMRDLTRESWPAFPPTWQDPVTGAQPLRHDPLAGILVAIAWDQVAPYIDLTNYWRGKRLAGRLVVDDVSLLPRVHALLSAVIPMHIDELVEMELPALGAAPATRSPDAPATPPVAAAEPPAAEPVPAAPVATTPPIPAAITDMEPDLAALVVALVTKGLLGYDDIEAARATLRGARPSPRANGPRIDPPPPQTDAAREFFASLQAKRLTRK